jgi:hypothetical protein
MRACVEICDEDIIQAHSHVYVVQIRKFEQLLRVAIIKGSLDWEIPQRILLEAASSVGRLCVARLTCFER